MNSEQEIKRHPLAIAWDKWLESEEGSCAVDPGTLGLPSGHRKFLESRLNRAFMAGASTLPLEGDKLKLRIMELIDGFVKSKADPAYDIAYRNGLARFIANGLIERMR